MESNPTSQAPSARRAALSAEDWFRAKPLADGLRERIDSLADSLDAARSRRPRRHFPQFDERRHTLLEEHLGHPLAPITEPIPCLGDSNTMFFAGAERLRFIHYRRVGLWKFYWINRGLDLLPLFRVFHVGPATAWKAGDFGSSTRSREKIELLVQRDLLPGTKLILSFGEIDCRIHMARQVKEGRDIASVTRATAEKFLRLPVELKRRGFRPLVWGPPQIIPKPEKLDVPFPYVGPWEMRRDITYAYIEALREGCASEGIPFAALAGRYHPRAERAERFCFHDGTHLSQCLMPLALRELAATGFLPSESSPS